jgi:hypothetical protein
MTGTDRAIAAEPASGLHDPRLEVRLADVLVALITFAGSLAVLLYSMSADPRFEYFLLLHLAVLVVPTLLWTVRACRNGERTVPVLLTIATFAAGPVGALGCAGVALALWYQRPSPTRLQEWYDYVAGVVARSRLTRIYDELISGRLPHDPAAHVPRFRPILQGASVEEQQNVLGVLGRRYHPDFRAALRAALRHKNGFIRAQAAAVASRLPIDEKNRLWSTREDAREGAGGSAAGALDLGPPRP